MLVGLRSSPIEVARECDSKVVERLPAGAPVVTRDQMLHAAEKAQAEKKKWRVEVWRWGERRVVEWPPWAMLLKRIRLD